jgi:lipase chaperone LimK|tara:strand:+ start:3237 stop:3473 length:237 start_codon:yes stop_codon:yes gene_type:complete
METKKDFLEEVEKEKKELAESYKESVRQNQERLVKRLNSLPKLKQDIINSVFQKNAKQKYGDLVENILNRKRIEKQKT